MMVIVFDLDGTLADPSHRLHHAKLMVRSAIPLHNWSTHVTDISCGDMVTLTADDDFGVSAIITLKEAETAFEPDWDKFFSLVGDDEPIKEMVDLFKIFQVRGDMYTVVATGRSSVCTDDTMGWLDKQGVHPDKVLFRREGDHRPDFKVKFDMLTTLMSEGLKPNIVFDDRQQVVDMWRKEGIRVCQVAPGNF